MRKFYLLAFAFFSFYTGISQTTDTLQNSRLQWISSIAERLRSTHNDICKNTAEELLNNYTAGVYSESQIEQMSLIYNEILRLKMRVFPETENYFRAINLANSALFEPRTISQFNTTMISLLHTLKPGNVSAYKRLIKFALSFFNSNAISDANSKQWVVEGGIPVFSFEAGKALVRFKNVDLITRTKNDTATIFNTEGIYFPVDQIWQGNSGRITWENSGLDPQNVYCELGNYQIDTKKSEFSADSVLMHYKPMISEAIEGKLVQRVMANKSNGDPKFPDFTSYQKRIVIDNLIDHVRYQGGFRLRGPNMIGTGDADQKACLTFLGKEGQVQALAKSESFKINVTTRASATEAEISLYFDNDSIYHPGIKMRFSIPDKTITLTTGDQGISKARFYDSYHKLEMDVDRLIWKLDEKKISMSMLGGGGQKMAYFESSDLFDIDLFNKYQGVLAYNPLVVMKNYCINHQTREIDALTLAQSFKSTLSVDQIKRTLYNLVEDGFIYYDEEKQLVTVKDKVLKYVAAAYQQEDYDVIKLGSIGTRENAVIDLNTKNLTIAGVDHFNLSNKNFVQVVPDSGSVVLEEGRNMNFSGTVFAGRVDFSGVKDQLDYEDYSITIDKLAKMQINIPSDKLDEFGQPVLQPIKTVFEDLQGVIYIDDPDNKAGKGKTGQYPMFENLVPSYIYYDKNCAYQDVYKRDNFYFAVNPFMLDSLQTFDVFSQAFAGQFHSGIFPEFQENLTVEPDLSLGFTHIAPTEGFPAYEGLGLYTGKLNMNFTGLHGTGNFKYLCTNFAAEDFRIFPDSVNSITKTFEVEEKLLEDIPFPSIVSDTVQVHWEPHSGFLNAKSLKTPFRFFNGMGTLKGSVHIQSEGITGKGTFDWPDAKIIADEFTFGMKSLMADTSNLTIKSVTEDKIAFNLPNVRSNIDLDLQTGIFTSNEENVPTLLPYNQYQTTMNSFIWDIEKRIIHFNPPKNKTFAKFTSMRPGQDSLWFIASKGSYNLNDYTLIAEGVPGIDVADARIIPGNKIVLIGADAKFEPVDSALIIIDTINQYHKFYNATVNILGRNEYKASGDYPYINRSGIAQLLNFTNIGVVLINDTVRTTASTSVLESDSFLLDPNIFFQGDATLKPGGQHLLFKGISHFDLPDSGTVNTDWFWIDQEVHANDVTLFPSKWMNLHRDSLIAGILYRSDTSLLYTNLAAPRIYRRDDLAFRVNGAVRYNPDEGKYEILDSLVAIGESEIGNKIIYDKAADNIYAEGKADLGADLGMIEHRFAVKISKSAEDTSYIMKANLAFDFNLTKDIWQIMTDDWQTLAFDAPDIDYTDEAFQSDFIQLLTTDKEAEKFRNSSMMTGIPDLPAELPKHLILTDVEMVWDNYYNSWRSIGKIGLSHINGTKMGKVVNGYVEIGRRTAGDFFNIYLETDLHDWYFITYQANMLQVLSSNPHFNDMVMDTKPKDRRTLGKDDDFIVFAISNPGKAELFVNRMKYLEDLRRSQKNTPK